MMNVPPPLLRRSGNPRRRSRSLRKPRPMCPLPPRRSGRNRCYITILFAAAFVLMLLAFMMERRQNEQVVDSLNQSVSGLRESLSNMQSAQDIYDENMELIEQINELQSENDRLTSENRDLSNSQKSSEQSVEAMGWFWQIDEAYVLGKYSLCRSLIDQMGEELVSALPTEAVTDNGRFSPADRYQEIYDAVY